MYEKIGIILLVILSNSSGIIDPFFIVVAEDINSNESKGVDGL